MKQKLLSLLALLMIGISGAWAQAGENVFEPATGTKYALKHVNTGLYVALKPERSGSKAVITSAYGAFTIEKVEGGYKIYNDNNQYLGLDGNWNIGLSNNATWKIITGEDGYVTLSKDGSQYVNLDSEVEGSALYTDKGTGAKWQIVDASTLNYTYTVKVYGPAAGRIIYNGTEYAHNATITSPTALTASNIEAKAVENEKVVNTGINGGIIYATYAADMNKYTISSVGAKTQTIENEKWYILTQVRNGESPAYDNGKEQQTLRETAANTHNVVVPVGATFDNVQKYMVRFVNANNNGAVGIQFGTGNFLNGVAASGNCKMKTTEAPLDFLVYAVSGTDGVAMNETSDGTSFGRKVDNDGAGGTLSFWGSGKQTGTGNALWSIYPVELEAPANPYYNITFNFTGAATGSKTIEVKKGDVPTLPITIPDYVDATVSPALAAVTGEATYTVATTYNSNAPFEPNSEKSYTMKMNRNPNLNIYTEGEEIKTVANTTATYETQNNFKWQFGGDWLNGFTLKNKGADKYVTYGSKNPASKYKATLTETHDEGAYFDLVINGGKNYMKLHGTTVDAYISNNGGAGTTFLTNWNSTKNIGDAGAQLLIAEAEDIPFDLTTIKAEAIASLPTNIPALYSEADIATATTAINGVTCGADQASIDAALEAIAKAKVDLLKTAEGKKVAFKSLPAFSTRDAEYYLTAEAAGTQMTSNTQLTKTAVYELSYNEVANAYTVKAISNETYLPKTGNASTAIATTDAANAGLYTFTSTSEADHRVIVTNTNGSNVSDMQGGIHLDGGKKIVVWGPTSGASQWVIEAVSDEQWADMNLTYDWAAFETLLDQVNAMSFGNSLGQYANAEVPDYSAPISDFVGYLNEDFNDKNEDQYDEDMEVMQWIVANKQLNMPKAGTMLRIKDADGKYMTCENANNKTVFSEEKNDKGIYCYTGSALVAYTNGFYASRYSNKPCGMSAATTEGAGTLYHIHASPLNKGKYLVSFGGDTRFMYKNADAGNYNGGPSTVNNAGYEFTLEEVETLPVTLSTVDGHNYGTFYTPVGISDLDGVKAYIATEKDGRAVMTTIETIPAETAVVLYAKDAEKTSATFTIGEARANTDGNILTGQVATIATVSGACTLQSKNDNLGFYSYNGAALKGFKAYLNASEHSVKSFTLDFDMETAIRGIQEAEENSAAMYDMSGRRIQKAQKGVYIQNGKKYVK